MMKFVVFIAETYDMNRIIEYPGFNVPALPGTVDVCDIHVTMYLLYLEKFIAKL